jgi:hypothetical protein
MLILYTKGTCNKIIRKPNNFPVKHRRTDKFPNYLSHKILFLFALHIINISNELYQHNLLSLQCSEDDCLADFVLQKDTRLNNPGACFLEFQSVMQILIECILQWDATKKNH